MGGGFQVPSIIEGSVSFGQYKRSMGMDSLQMASPSRSIVASRFLPRLAVLLAMIRRSTLVLPNSIPFAARRRHLAFQVAPRISPGMVMS